MSDFDSDVLKPYARKYIWWKTPEDAVRYPRRVIAQVMNIGAYEDVQELAKQIGENGLRETLLGAEAGEFNERSWHYWHYRLGLAELGTVPALPVRKLA